MKQTNKQTMPRFFPFQQLVPQQSSEEDHAPLTIERGTEDPTTFFKVLKFPPFQIHISHNSGWKAENWLCAGVWGNPAFGSRFPGGSHLIWKISTQKEDKKDAALCLLPKELEGTDIGVAAAAQAFKWVKSFQAWPSHTLFLRCANPPKPPQDFITFLHHSLQLHFPASFAQVWINTQIE